MGTASKTQRLKSVITQNYQFRINYERKIIGSNALEYKRNEWEYWMPTSQFGKYESPRIMWLAKVKQSNIPFLGINYRKSIQKIALNICERSEVQGATKELTSLFDYSPVKVSGVAPLSTMERRPVDAKAGDIVYVCLDADGNKDKRTVLPGYVDSIQMEGDELMYNLLVIKADKRVDQIMYHGQHRVFQNEIGLTPAEAVANLAYSQIVY
ncbi:MAG: hypothetical protein KDC92_01835 [Bacteroidetes bacterium]|nr:hypothetical protein [Bacteroidota bacterium]